jgi:isopentenyldiphosphate isomerase
VESGETYASAARRRVSEELGIRPRLRRVDKFAYTACWRDDGENEICAIFTARAEKISPDPQEIDALKFERRPKGRLTPWLKIALMRISFSGAGRARLP